MGSTRIVGTVRYRHLGDAASTSVVLTGTSVTLDGRMSKSLPMRKPFSRLELLGWLSVPYPWGRQGAE
jgi:hypothetical protein